MTRIKWKTIDTAPKDGRFVLLCRALDADGDPIGKDSFGVFCQVATWGDEEGWIVYCSMIREPTLHFEPSHWAPLPQNPYE